MGQLDPLFDPRLSSVYQVVALYPTKRHLKDTTFRDCVLGSNNWVGVGGGGRFYLHTFKGLKLKSIQHALVGGYILYYSICLCTFV